MSACLTLADFELYDAGEQDDVALAGLRAHLDSCQSCRNAFDEFRRERGDIGDGQPLSVTLEDSHTPAVPEHEPIEETWREGDPLATQEDTSPRGKMAKHFPKIEGYRILGVLGHGGMGIVYHAVQTKLNRAVALKVLPAIVGTASPSAVSRFRREATAAARLHHSHIVPIYDFGESRDSYYYAMELISGQPLNVLVRRFAEQDIGTSGPSRLAEALRTALMGMPATVPAAAREVLPADEPPSSIGSSSTGRGRPYYQQVARWMADAADALHYAHGEGIVHRDIKPANLILSTDGRIMIADFGLAKLVGDESVTMTGALLGTLRYISPEQAMAKRVRVDHRTDIYSLGATLYELLCFQPAFPGDDDKEVLGAIIARDPTPPRKIEHHVPSELETICLKTLEKAPDARYQTARALVEDLQRYIHDLPIVAKRPGFVQRSIKFARRRRALVVAVAAAVLLVASMMFLFRERASRFREKAMREAAQVQAQVDQVKALYESGMFFAQTQNWEDAEAEFKKALDINPDDIRTILGFAWMKLEYFKKNPEAATVEQLEELDRFCRHVLKLVPNQLTALNYHGVVLKKLGRYDEAIAAAEHVIELAPKYYPVWCNLGAYHAVMNDLDKAEHCLRQGAELAEANVRARAEDRAGAWRNLAAFELYLQRDSAADHVARAIEAKPDYIPSWALQVHIRLQRNGAGDREEALDDAKHADRLAAAKDPRGKRMLALARLRNGQFDQAVKHADLAIQLGDMWTVNHLIIAIAEAKRGNPVGARNHLTAAVNAWPARLREAAFFATFDEGILWFESRAELVALRDEAEHLISPNPRQP